MLKQFFPIIILFGLVSSFTLGPALAETNVEYKIPALCDFAGPYADLMKFMVPTRKAVVAWWNDTEGKELGIKLTLKNYDTRYDATVVASMWPGILNDLKPIIIFGLGGTDVAALQQRLPQDKVPAVYSTSGYGYAWLPDQWTFNPRPTYTHAYMGALCWYIEQHPEKRPVKVAFMSTQASPAYIDIVNGGIKYVETVLAPKGLAKVVAKEWIEIQPVDVSSQMKTVIDAKADVLIGLGNTTMAAAGLRAQQLYGVSIPTIASPHMTIWPLSMAMKSFAPWEGHYVVAGHTSVSEKDGRAYEFYKILQEKYGMEGDWNPLYMMGICQGLLGVRAVEHAAKAAGSNIITGEDVYNAIATGTFTEKEMMSILPTLNYSKSAPFPVKDTKVKITTVKNGKMQLATPEWVSIPADIPKW